MLLQEPRARSNSKAGEHQKDARDCFSAVQICNALILVGYVSGLDDERSDP